LRYVSVQLLLYRYGIYHFEPYTHMQSLTDERIIIEASSSE